MSELWNWVRSRSFSRGVRRWMNGSQLLWKTLENNRPNLREFGFSHRIVNLKHARNASFLPVIRAQSSPVSKDQREPLEKTKENWFMPWKWSSPLSPIPNTKRKIVAGGDPQSHEGYKCKKTKPNYHEKPTVRNQIQGILANLEAECPFFLKCMIPSDVVKNKSSLTLPKQFCQAHLPIHDTTITLEHESGKQYEVKFLAKYRRLSGGWRSFCNESKLLKGDLLVFQWVRPLMKFKVYKVEADTLIEVDASFILLTLSLSTATLLALYQPELLKCEFDVCQGNIQKTSLTLDANLEDDQSESDNDQELSSKSTL
ncbi:hypothetical protein M0R45_007825 [Rubus argutus]|uniref:TF-B3 domain-containing protein n=1 Tax=Rubus argutus TaxID=59490 RepID=A0AAW1XZH7_RUBAR